MASEWRIGKSYESRVGFGPGSEFGFQKPLRFFNLLTPIPRTDPNPVQHMLGFGFPALPRQKNLLPFFRLLTRFAPLRAPHNRQVEGSSPSGPTIYYKNHRVIDS